MEGTNKGNGKPPAGCRALTRKGEPCRSFLVRPSGYCLRHDPDPEARAIARAASLRGGLNTRAKRRRLRSKGRLDIENLGPLNQPEDAQRWAEAAVVAVATGGLTAPEAQAVRSLLREWREAHQAGQVTSQLRQLTDALREWRRTGDPTEVLQLVERKARKSA